ncbi:MAG TPA: hypothetical protein VHV82_23520 [Sporichthyaceae bacterium]|jgi:hypothetical protein|nr:hypothetical protein [Sporichthyaceae bacterium]
MAAAETRPPSAVLPETEAVYWRPRVDEARLRRMDVLWTLTTLGHVVPFTLAAAGLLYVEPRLAPVAIVLAAHAWIIPELYAHRGANVLRPQPRGADGPERRSVGLLGDLVGHEARELHARTGLVREEGRLGTWLVGEAGALLVRKGGRRVHCYCVRVNAPNLPSGDRIAHLLLALRADEQGFATVANLAFSGARWRVRRRLRKAMRSVLSRKMRFHSRSRPVR